MVVKGQRSYTQTEITKQGKTSSEKMLSERLKRDSYDKTAIKLER